MELSRADREMLADRLQNCIEVLERERVTRYEKQYVAALLKHTIDDIEPRNPTGQRVRDIT